MHDFKTKYNSWLIQTVQTDQHQTPPTNRSERIQQTKPTIGEEESTMAAQWEHLQLWSEHNSGHNGLNKQCARRTTMAHPTLFMAPISMSAVKNGIPLSTDYNNVGNLLVIVNKIHLSLPPPLLGARLSNEGIVGIQTLPHYQLVEYIYTSVLRT